MTEVVEKDQNSKSDPDRIGNLQNRKSVGAFSHNKGVELVKKTSEVNVIIESHNREGCPKKRNQAYEENFNIAKYRACGRADPVGDDKIRFSDGRNINGRFHFQDHFQKIRDGHYISARFHGIQDHYLHDAEAVELFCISHGKGGNVLEIYMRI